MRIAIVACVLFLCACACGRTVDASQYSRACSADADCVLVADGDLCGPCHCLSATIAASELPRFNGDADGVCLPRLDTVECLCALPPSPVCAGGQCQIPATR